MIDEFLRATNSWSDQLSLGLIVFALRASVLLAAAFLATRLLKNGSAALRHLVWTAAVAGVVALPVLSVVIPAWEVPVVTITADVDSPLGPGSETEQASPPVAVPSVSAARTIPPAPTPAAPAATASAPLPSIFDRVSATTMMAALWLAVAALLLLRLAIANARVSGWKRASDIVDDGRWNSLMRRLTRDYQIERPVVLLQSGDTDIPVTWGVVYPVVLIPANADDWDEEQRTAVLTHELAHVKRFDALSQMVGQVALALLWFHPLAWVAVRRMRQEREHACDDFVLAAGARASRYADDLLGLARRLSRPTAPAAAALAMARRSELEGRLLAILDPAVKRGAVRQGKVGILAMLVLLCVVPLSAFKPGARVNFAPVKERPVAQAQITVPLPRADAQQTATLSAPVESNATRDSASTALDALIAQLGGVRPEVTKLQAKLPALSRFGRDTEPQSAPVDVATLIEVTRAAKRMTSDYEKGLMLALIAKRYVRDDSLRDAYLDAAFTMTSDHERSNAIVALLKRDSIPSYSTAKVLRSAKGMSSDVSRGVVLKAVSPETFADTLVQRAYMEVITAMTSDFERAQAISVLIKAPRLSQAVQLGILRATTAISGNNDKANVLLLFVQRQGLADDVVRRSFMKAAETLSSDYDYRRVMTAVMR